jgi:DNA replication and repair protein RecF
LFSKISETIVNFFWSKHRLAFPIFVVNRIFMHTHLSQLTLLNFKNYEEASLEFCPKINCLVGNNGIGKTNVLDAIYYLSLCKSAFNAVDVYNVKHGQDFFVIQGEYSRDGKTEHISCGVKTGHKKVFKRNGKEYEKISDHIGLLPLVIISPLDSSLILEGSEERRKFMDSVLSQFNHQYLDDLMRYNRALAQRNLLLKDFAQKNWFDPDMLDMWNEQMLMTGNRIFEKRSVFIRELIPVFQHYYEFVSGGTETVELAYESQLLEHSFAGLLAGSVDKDRRVLYTTAGVHKDDLVLKLSGHPIKRAGSQGQQKTFLVALKLAQFDYIKQQTADSPLLLLDDIFDKFDTSRVGKIINLVASPNFGQIFITDTSRERMGEILRQMDGDYKLFVINENGFIHN